MSAIVVRTVAQADLEEMGAVAEAPVINALTDEHHPCRAPADLLTLRERLGSLEGLRLAYVGDGNNVAHSLVQAGALAGMHVAVVAPAERHPDAGIWVSMGEDAERQQRLCDLEPYRVDETLMAKASPEAVFMHCLPSHRGEEVTAAVIDGPASVVFPQAANRLPTEQAVLATLVNAR